MSRSHVFWKLKSVVLALVMVFAGCARQVEIVRFAGQTDVGMKPVANIR
jgi:hypothetical protein